MPTVDNGRKNSNASRISEGNRDIRYPAQETEEERYQRQQAAARATGILHSPSAANAAAASYLYSQQASLIQQGGGACGSGRACSATNGAGPSEIDRRARDAIAIIQLRLLREKLRKERELLNSSSEVGDSDDSSSASGDNVTDVRLKQALAQREELLRQIEELRLGLNKNNDNIQKTLTPLPVQLTSRTEPSQPQPIIVQVQQPPHVERQTGLSDIQTLSAAIREAASATVAPPHLPTPRAPVIVTTELPQKELTIKASGTSMGDKYQELMEMMMMQNYQMQQMVMQQALLGAVTGNAAAPMPGLASCVPAGRPAIVQIAGKKHRGHHMHGHCHGHHGGGGGFQPQMAPAPMMPQMPPAISSQSVGNSGVDRRMQQQLEQQTQLLQQMQQQQSMFSMQGGGRRQSSSSSGGAKASRQAAVMMAAMQPHSSPVTFGAAGEGDVLHLPKDRRREIKEAKVGDIDWNAPDTWWKKDRVSIKIRHFFYVAWFIGNLKAAAAEKGKSYDTEKVAFDDVIAFEIIIREIIAGIHRIYLDPDSEMYQLLQTLISPNAIDLRLALRESPEALQELTYLVENITFQMTYIQPWRPLLFHLRSLVAENSPDLSRALAPYLPPQPPTFDAQGNPILPPTLEQIEEATRRIEDYVLNIVYHCCFDIPDAGVLGTHRRSHLFALIKDGNLFPLEEFWEIEKKLLRFDSNGRTANIGTREAMLLLMMMFLARGLVWTILLNPVDYGLTPVDPDPVSKENLKLIASIFMYLYRRLIVPRDARVVPPIPQEVAYLLVRDEVLKPLLERIENTIIYCDGLFREWANAYVRRLKQALPPKIASD